MVFELPACTPCFMIFQSSWNFLSFSSLCAMIASVKVRPANVPSSLLTPRTSLFCCSSTSETNFVVLPSAVAKYGCALLLFCRRGLVVRPCYASQASSAHLVLYQGLLDQLSGTYFHCRTPLRLIALALVRKSSRLGPYGPSLPCGSSPQTSV